MKGNRHEGSTGKGTKGCRGDRHKKSVVTRMRGQTFRECSGEHRDEDEV